MGNSQFIPIIGESYCRASWRYVSDNFRREVKTKLRNIVAAVISVAVTLRILLAFGSEGAAWDFAIERLMAAPIAVCLTFVFVHLAWAFAGAQRKLYYAHQDIIVRLQAAIDCHASTEIQRENDRRAMLTALTDGEALFNERVNSDSFPQWSNKLDQWIEATKTEIADRVSKIEAERFVRFHLNKELKTPGHALGGTDHGERLRHLHYHLEFVRQHFELE